MINLARYRQYWQNVADRLDSVTGVLPVTIDKEMSRRIQSLRSGSVTLFVFPPMAEGSGKNVDSFSEGNNCVLFVMKKYDPQRQTSFDVLEETQPVAEAVKSLLLDDQRAPCFGFKVELQSIETAPETELFGMFAGWSVAFNAKTPGL